MRTPLFRADRARPRQPGRARAKSSACYHPPLWSEQDFGAVQYVDAVPCIYTLTPCLSVRVSNKPMTSATLPPAKQLRSLLLSRPLTLLLACVALAAWLHS